MIGLFGFIVSYYTANRNMDAQRQRARLRAAGEAAKKVEKEEAAKKAVEQPEVKGS